VSGLSSCVRGVSFEHSAPPDCRLSSKPPYLERRVPADPSLDQVRPRLTLLQPSLSRRQSGGARSSRPRAKQDAASQRYKVETAEGVFRVRTDEPGARAPAGRSGRPDAYCYWTRSVPRLHVCFSGQLRLISLNEMRQGVFWQIAGNPHSGSTMTFAISGPDR
jgi:hypothetical protein